MFVLGSRSFTALHSCLRLQACADSTPEKAAPALLSLLACTDVKAAPADALLADLASGMLSHLAGWVIRVTQQAANLLVRCRAKGCLCQLGDKQRAACFAGGTSAVPAGGL